MSVRLLGIGLALSGLLAGCNRLFWRERSDFHSAHWIEAHRVMEVRLLYSEKTPWDLLAGTTLKKDLRTRLYEMVREGGAFKVQRESADMPGQPEYDLGLFQGEIIFLQRSPLPGGELTPPRLYAWDRNSRSFRQRLPDSIAAYTLRGFLLSPDSRRLLLRLEKERREAFLLVMDWREIAAKPLVLDEVTEIAWHPDSSHVFFRRSREVLSWDGRDAVARAPQFPRCFQPATRWGLSISPTGEMYHREKEDSAPEILVQPERIFGRQGMVSDIKQIGTNCE
ncbi:MAG: hypothetical protein HS115_05340 [Spirochaetales bacterium]|nr:hypothetical protein [Spirochaetales bacterium]